VTTTPGWIDFPLDITSLTAGTTYNLTIQFKNASGWGYLVHAVVICS